MMYQGSCLCGQIKITISGPISAIIHCHCSKCRKTSGTAYATNGFVLLSDFAVTAGAEQLSFYEATPGKKRYFCRTCACPVYSSNTEQPDKIRLRLGILDDDIQERPLSHNFVSSKACWDDLDASLPRYNGHEPGR